MRNIPDIIALILAIAAIAFTTVNLFKGNLEAAFSAVPFLLIIYFFAKRHRN
jgi:hypothetical protein